jgi:CheY-like chemotaxis protein
VLDLGDATLLNRLTEAVSIYDREARIRYIVILGGAQLLLHRVSSTDPMHDELSEIAAAAERATIITRQLLAFGRRQRLAPLNLNLSDHIESTEPVLRRMLGEHVEVDFDLQPALGYVWVDPGQIEQVLLNLAANALDAMPAGGRLEIRTANVTLPDEGTSEDDGVPAGRYAKLTVRDFGNGMPEDVRAHVFEPFFTTKDHGGGAGLGLATVHGIVEQSSGFIRVHSEPGKGTAFHVYLPRVDDEPASLAAGAGRLAPDERYSGTETLLLVEDDPAMRQYVRRTLRQRGYQVLDAESAGAALLILEQHVGAVDLLVSDVVMSRMSGPQLATRLRAMHPRLPALYISGYSPDRVDDTRELGANESFVAKPFGPEELLRAVRAAIDGPGRA